MAATDTPVNPQSIPAATVVVFRNNPAGGAPEVLMVTRARSMAFAGGAAVFPGGRVDPEDFALARTLNTPHDEDEAAHRIAAIRETLEETGLAIGVSGPLDAQKARQARAMLLESGQLAPVLEAMGWTLNLDALHPFARWNPQNERLARVFDTRFYLADLGTGDVDVAVDATENTQLFWTTAQGALDMAERGELQVIFPTRRNLERLAKFADFAAAADECARIPVRTIVPFLTQEDGVTWLRIADDLGYPVTGQPFNTVRRG